MMLVALMLSQAATALGPDDLATLSTPALAARVMAAPPPGLVEHTILDDAAGGGIEFFTAAEHYGDGLCRRRAYFVSAISARGPQDLVRSIPATQEQLAIAADCTAVPAGNFAWVQPARELDGAAAALRWLVDRQRRNDGDGVTCLSSSFKPDPCADGARAALQRLPLDRTYIINRGSKPGNWSLSVMPKGPGQLYYHVQLARDATGKPSVTIRWDAPAPF